MAAVRRRVARMWNWMTEGTAKVMVLTESDELLAWRAGAVV